MKVSLKNRFGDAAKHSHCFTPPKSGIYRLQTGRLSLATLSVGLTVSLIGCGGSDSPVTPTLAPSFAVAKANCGNGDRPESGLQGQIPMAERMAGFKGFNCNLEKLSGSISKSGEAVYEQTAVMRDRSGRLCAYTGPAFLDSAGTKVVDMTNPNNIVETTVLKTPGMINPGEGLKVHEGRGLLVSAHYNNAPSAKEEAGGFDVYDVGTDCRYPQLLATSTRIKFSTDGVKPALGTGERLYGHEGAFSPDGLTYWVGDITNNAYHAIDIADPTKPNYLASFQYSNATSSSGTNSTSGRAHGLSVANDGNRAYPVLLTRDRASPGGMVPQTGPHDDGFMVVDTSEVQARRPSPKMRMISATTTRDTSAAQLTIPVTIAGNPYVIFVPEGGTAQFNTAGFKSACAAGKTPFALPQIYYMGDENKPELINKVVLEANDPKNCSTVSPEVEADTGIFGWAYDVHHCAVDNRDNATTLACGFFQAGIRVYDIRDPRNIKEIAYFNPAALNSGLGSVGWCASMPFLDAKSGMLYSRCRDSGTVALKFKNGVWPFPESSTPPGKQL